MEQRVKNYRHCKHQIRLKKKVVIRSAVTPFQFIIGKTEQKNELRARRLAARVGEQPRKKANTARDNPTALLESNLLL